MTTVMPLAIESQSAYVEAMIRAMRLRLRALAKDDDDDRPERDAHDAALRSTALAAANEGVAMPMLWLRDRLQLSETEEQVVWLLLAHEVDVAARKAMRVLNTESVSDATLDAIRRVVYGFGVQARAGAELAAAGPLRRLGLIERTDDEERCPEHRQTFALSRRVLALALGDASLDPALESIASIPSSTLTVADLVAAPKTVDHLRATLTSSNLVAITARSGSGRRSLLLATLREKGLDALQIDGRAIAPARDVAQLQLRAIARECRLLGRIPLVCHLDALAAAGEIADRIDLVETELTGLVVATVGKPIARQWRRAPVWIELPPPTGAERARLWAQAIPEASDGDAEVMSTMYSLAPAMIVAAGEAAHRQAGTEELTTAHIAAGIRSVLDDRLAGLATRITVTQSWDDIVLPEDQVTALVELLARIRQRRTVYETWGFADKVGRGLGVSALLSGPPGTGKTMAAGLLARDLGVEIYQVDLSKIASKWIGETERNLGSVFDAAEAGHAILLFDEADSLFGKRTEVRTSNDRYANQGVNYLLQRMEQFVGVCILTTNHENAIDEAFRRRLSIHVRFPMPEAEERKKLWRAMLPANAPIAPDLRFDLLGQTFAMSGGYIRNAVLRAAFLAADTTGTIDTALLTRAAQLEYEALGKIVSTS